MAMRYVVFSSYYRTPKWVECETRKRNNIIAWQYKRFSDSTLAVGNASEEWKFSTFCNMQII